MIIKLEQGKSSQCYNASAYYPFLLFGAEILTSFKITWKFMSWFQRINDLFEGEQDPEVLLGELQHLSEGLQLTSESDAPLLLLDWLDCKDRITEANVIKHLHLPENSKMKKLTVAKFLKPHCQNRRYHSEEKKKEVARFQKIKQFFEEKLKNSIVFLIGEVEQTVLIVGRVGEQGYIGLQSSLIRS